MPIGYLILVAAACALLAMAIEAVLRSSTLLNLAAALLLLNASVILGAGGLSEFFLLGHAQWVSLTMMKVQNAAGALLGFSFFTLSLLFPRDPKPQNMRVFLLPALAVSAVLAAVTALGLDISRVFFVSSSTSADPEVFSVRVLYNTLHWIILGLSGSLAAFSTGLIAWKYPRSALQYQKKQIRYFLAGMVVLILTLSAAWAVRILKLPTTVSHALVAGGTLVAAGALLFTVVAFRFTNIRRGLLSFLRENAIGLVIALPLVVLLFVLRPWLATIGVLVYVLVMPPVFLLFFWLFDLSKDLVKRLLNLRTAAQDMTEKLLDRIGRSRTVEELAKNVIETVTENVNSRSADFLLFDRERESYRTLYSSSQSALSVPAIEPVFRHLADQTEVLDREVVLFDPRYSHLRDTAGRYFDRYGAALIVPVLYEGHVTALMHLTDKLDNSSYTRKELDLIAKIRKIAQMTLSSIILFDLEQQSRLTKRDLSLASVIQESIFQRDIPAFSGMDVAAALEPAQGVSGDYFFIHKANNNAMGILIADVAGKGFPAALVAMMIHTIAKTSEFSSVTTNAIVAKVNDLLTSGQEMSRLTRTLSFATVFCAFLDRSVQTLFYTNAGHNPALVYDPDTDGFESIRSNAKPPGIFPEQDYVSRTYRLKPGQILTLYSDGVTEAINPQEEEFGLDRLQAVIRSNAKKPAETIVSAVLDGVKDFADKNGRFDDMTLIVIKL